MSRKEDKLRKSIAKSSELAGTSKKSNKRTSRGKLSNLVPHKHCKICQCTIDFKRDSSICGDENCELVWNKRKNNDKLVRIAFFVFAIVFLGPLLLQGFGLM